MEKSMNVKDITILSEYISAKKKMFQPLVMIDEYLTSKFNVKGSNRNYGMASKAEAEDNEFVLYFYLNEYFTLYLGFWGLDEDYEGTEIHDYREPLGVHIDGNKKQK